MGMLETGSIMSPRIFISTSIISLKTIALKGRGFSRADSRPSTRGL
jgi:hypothetical protein